MNTYLYTNANPIRFIDPKGLDFYDDVYDAMVDGQGPLTEPIDIGNLCAEKWCTKYTYIVGAAADAAAIAAWTAEVSSGGTLTMGAVPVGVVASVVSGANYAITITVCGANPKDPTLYTTPPGVTFAGKGGVLFNAADAAANIYQLTK